MTQWLAGHPDVFMPEIKVPCHFGTDLDMAPKRRFRDPDAYLTLFAEATTQKRLGESTPFYLYSERAAREIQAFDPAARIIIMLRNPVDMMYSMHARNLMDGNETIKDFAAALDAEPARKEGRRLPASCFFRQGLYYRELARFPKQLKRYMEVLDPAQLRVIIFDDLKRDPQASLKNVLSFLDLDAELDAKLDRANQSITVRSPALAGFLRKPPTALLRLAAGLGQSFIWRLNRWNTSTTHRVTMDPTLRRKLLEEFASDVDDLGNLLQRDLSPWLS